MDNQHCTWTLPPSVRAAMAASLKPSERGTAFQALCEIYLAYHSAENETRGLVGPTPSDVKRLISDALKALQRLEQGADADTLQIIEEPLNRLVQGLAQRRQILSAYGKGGIRKTDSRTEHERVCCGMLSLVWGKCALTPTDRRARRKFAILFLDAAGIAHPGREHPERLDDWLDTPVDSVQIECVQKAAQQASEILKDTPR